jgi:RimJ/RimL family protein N-acetyltransferase
MTIRDSEAMFEVYSDMQTMEYWSAEPVPDLAGAQERVQADLDWVENGHALLWTITAPPSDKALGKCVVFQFSPENRRAEIGYVINRSHWGQGLMTEALEAMIDFAFGRLKLHRIEVDTDPENTGSMRLMDKLGFRREGLFRERWYVHGKWHDSQMLALLKAEWKGNCA